MASKRFQNVHEQVEGTLPVYSFRVPEQSIANGLLCGCRTPIAIGKNKAVNSTGTTHINVGSLCHGLRLVAHRESETAQGTVPVAMSYSRCAVAVRVI